MLHDNDSYRIFYDKTWNTVSVHDAQYCLKITVDTSDDVVNTIISVYDLDDLTSIYELEVKKYIPAE